MIGESSGVSTLLNNERISRENQVQSDDGTPLAREEENQERTVSDVAQFSAEALALSREVVAAGQSSEQGQIEPQGRGQEGEPGIPESSLDIRV